MLKGKMSLYSSGWKQIPHPACGLLAGNWWCCAKVLQQTLQDLFDPVTNLTGLRDCHQRGECIVYLFTWDLMLPYRCLLVKVADVTDNSWKLMGLFSTFTTKQQVNNIQHINNKVIIFWQRNMNLWDKSYKMTTPYTQRIVDLEQLKLENVLRTEYEYI